MSDATSLEITIGLTIVCEEKAEHIRANWQDRITANAWAAASREFDRCAPRIKKLMGAR